MTHEDTAINGALPNRFLSHVCRHMRKARPLIPDDFNYSLRREQIADAPFVMLWFRTKGCRHDLRGGCTMCNYGISTPVPPESMVDYVRMGLSHVGADKQTMLLVSPSGSMFDEAEVPASARDAIFDLMRQRDYGRYLCETRADSITDDKIRQYAQIFKGKQACVEMGLESANPWILKYCVNKAMSLDQYTQGLNILDKHGILSVANIMVGTIFLSPREAISDAITTVKWALDHGVRNCVLFPVHVKAGTLVEWLWKHKLYQPPSLWSLVAVLSALGPDYSSKVTISWYKTYEEEGASGPIDTAASFGYLASPATCPSCQSRVMRLLDLYRNHNDYAIVSELASINCGCKQAWAATLKSEAVPLRSRVDRAYEIIGKELMGEEWWQINADTARPTSDCALPDLGLELRARGC